MTLEDILMLEGVVVRHIPKETVSYWREYITKESTTPPPNLVRHNGVLCRKEVKQNSLAGFALTFRHDQYSMVRFNKNTDGFGSTVLEAYQDYLEKNKE